MRALILKMLIKQLLKKSKWLIVLSNIYINFRNKLKQNKEGLTTSIHNVIDNFSLNESLKHIDQIFEDYFSYLLFPIENIKGKRVLEIVVVII